MAAVAERQDQPSKLLKLTRASDITARKVHFIATDLIPMGTLTVLSGNSGIGKTTIALSYLAQLTKGTLDGYYKGKPQSVLVLSPEDDEASVTRPRLEAAGADLDLVHFMSATRKTASGDIDSYVQFPEDTPMLIEAVKQTGAALVMIDPISSLLSGNLDRREDVRASFDRLAAEVAKEYRLGIILVAHNRKGAGQVRHMVSGSTAITDAARSVLAVAKDEENETVVLAIDKSSYSKAEGINLAYALTSVEVRLGTGDTTTVARADFLGQSDVTVAELHARHSGEEQVEDDRNAAQAFLVDYLGGQPGCEAKAGDVIKAGRASGFNENDVKNGRKRCRDPKIVSRRARGEAHGWVWALEYDTQDVSQGVKESSISNVDTLTPSLTPRTEELTKNSKVSSFQTLSSSSPSVSSSEPQLAPVTPIGGVTT